MHIDWIDTFLDLWETQNFNRTAERLGVRQSTVSGRLQSLEKALGAQVFTRGRAGAVPTTAGLKFEPHARTLALTWAEARQSVGHHAAMTLRIGVQHDLLDNQIGDWVAAMRNALPTSALYVEPDYSRTMCQEILDGRLDLAILYTPTSHPDLHFETLGEVGYVMVSTEVASLDDVTVDRYILPNYSPAFARTHGMLLPDLSLAEMSSGHATVVRGLLQALGGSTYLPDGSSAGLRVWGAPKITQPVYAALHLRHRHRPAFRRLVRALRDTVPGMAGHEAAPREMDEPLL